MDDEKDKATKHATPDIRHVVLVQQNTCTTTEEMILKEIQNVIDADISVKANT